jgi:hypothetical protein
MKGMDHWSDRSKWGSKRDPSWEKAEKLKNLKVKTIRPKT